MSLILHLAVLSGHPLRVAGASSLCGVVLPRLAACLAAVLLCNLIPQK